MKQRNVLRIAADIALCESVGVIGSLFTAPAVSSPWYQRLNKPDFQPPGWIFGPVWILLYALMGVALYEIQRRDGPAAKPAYGIFGVQLGLNLLWSILFFGLRSPVAALVEILLLWAAIWSTVLLFWRISKPAALLLVPYLAWTTFAMALNATIWRLNR